MRPCPQHRVAARLRGLGALCVALLAFAAPVSAHEGAAHPAPHAAAATATQTTGRLVAINVANRMTGQAQRVAALEAAGGRRYLLRNATSLQEGATVAVTGRMQGQLVVAETVRTLAAAPAATPKAAPARATLEGTLRMFHVDYTDGRPAEFGYALVTDSGRQNIVDLGTLLPMLENGMRASVSGPVDAQGYISVDSIELTAPSTLKYPRDRAAAVGPPLAVTTGYLTMPLNYPTNAAAPWTYNADPFTIASITSSVYGAAPTLSVAEYYKEVSFGAQLISGVVAHASGAWLKATVAKPTACATSAELNAVLASIESQADAAALAQGFNAASYTGVLYVINSLPCGWAGLGYIGWERAYAKGTASLGVVGHEFGHNFGLYHAGSLDCGAEVIATSGCNVTEYGDPFVIMGNQRSMHLNAFQKELLGYIPSASVTTHGSGSTSYTINPIELAGQSNYAVVIPTLSANRTYWLEFRQPIGFDSGLSAFPNNGAQVRVARPFEFNNCGGCSGLYDDTQFLDMTPGTATFTDGTLVAGTSFTDPTYNVLISVTSATATELTVQVTTGGSITTTTTSLGGSPNPSTFGQVVTFTATVIGAAPTGSVAFLESGTPLAGCSSVPLAGTGNTRTAQCTSSTLATGVHSIVATYGGNASNSASTSVALSQTVRAATTTTLASSANPSVAGNSVTFTATVTGAAPTGTVAFTSDAVAIAGCTAVSLAGTGNTRTAACTTSALAAGTRAIVASYGGNSANGTSSGNLSQVVNGAPPAATTTTLVSSANPSLVGAAVTFTASVTGSAPTGNVGFTAGGVAIAGCTAVALAGSGNTRTAACTTSSLAQGTRAIVASYGGNGSNAASTSATLSQVVNAAPPAPTTTTLGSSANPATVGAAVTFTASVTGVAPTGNVAFTSDGIAIGGCTAVALAGAGNTRTAACTTAALATGAHAIVAGYAGGAGNAASTSAPLNQVVNAGTVPATRTTVTSALNPVPAGTPPQLTATITSTLPVDGGTVSFTGNGNPIAGCQDLPLSTVGSTRSATCSPVGLAAGAYSVVAAYSGHATGAPSASPVFAQVVSHVQIGNTVQFAAASYTVNESAGTATIAVNRIGDVSLAASVTYSMAVGTATGADFSSSAGTLAWGPGDSTPRAIDVPIVNDGSAEPNESFTVNLSSPAGAALGAVASATVTIIDDESAAAAMPGSATIAQNPYGTLTVQGGTLNGASISTLAKSTVLQLGNVAGTAGSFAQIDFEGFDIGAGNTLVVRAGAPGQTVYLVNAGGSVASIAGLLEAQAGAGAPPPVLYVKSAAGLTIVAGGRVVAPAGLTLDALGGTPLIGQPIVNHGIADGGNRLQLLAARVTGGGLFKGDAALLSTFGNANNPVNGAHFLANGLHFHPGSGNDLALTLSAYGGAPQFLNLMLHGNATVAMPSAWPAGSPLPPNNRPVMPGETRAAGVPDPAYGGGSMIVQATGTLTLAGGTSGDFVFPGGIVLKANGALDVKGTSLDNAWTTSGASFQGVFLEAPSITDTGPGARIDVRTNNLNWANVMPRPQAPVRTWTLQRQPDGTAQLLGADAVAPHLNFYSISSEAGAAGTCYVCLVNAQVVDMTVVP